MKAIGTAAFAHNKRAEIIYNGGSISETRL